MIGLESALSFGDACFNIPLIQAICAHYGDTAAVATIYGYEDGFYNIPCISEIISIRDLGDGIRIFENRGYEHIHQITQCRHFVVGRSLIDVPLEVGRKIGIPDFDQRPLFYPTADELRVGQSMLSDKPTIAIESFHKSGQSWANPQDFYKIVDKYISTHRILWLSHKDAPDHPNVDDMKRFTRREAIMCMQGCEAFFTSGSGFFCASLSLPLCYQPKKIVCLWKDEIYQYESALARLNFHNDITWIHNTEELQECLDQLRS